MLEIPTMDGEFLPLRFEIQEVTADAIRTSAVDQAGRGHAVTLRRIDTIAPTFAPVP